MELNKQQLDRQDLVDNAINSLLCDLCPEDKTVIWDMEYISLLREAVQTILVDDLKLMSEMEFYPYLEETND